MRTSLLVAAWWLVVALAVAARAGAQATTCTITNNGNNASTTCTSPNISMTVLKTVRLETTQATVTLADGDLTAADYAAGFKNSGTLNLKAYSNVGSVQVTLAAATANFSYSGSASPAPTKAASSVKFSTNGGASFTNLSTTGQTVLGPVSGATNGTSAALTFQTQLGWTTDPPGTYSLTLNLTITAP